MPGSLPNFDAQPAPAPLPGDDGVMCARLLFACTGHPHALIPWPHRLLHDAVAHISDLTRRLADAEAENGRFAGMLEDSVSGWRKLYTEERAERVRIEGVLLNDVQAERQESDEHIKGLNAVIKTQDKAIRDLKSRVRELEANTTLMMNAHAHDDMALTAAYLSGAHEGKKQAEAERDALRELEAESMTFRTECINLETQRADLEAFKARVMAWASERCICGLVGKACPKGMFDGETKWATSGPCPNWMPPQAWEVGE